MNPNTSAIAAPPGLVHDIAPPAARQPAAPNPVAAPIKAEVVESIPVKNPLEPAQAGISNPVAGGAGMAVEPAAPPAKQDNELEKILKAVSHRVKASDELEQRQAKLQKVSVNSMAERQMILPAAVALIVAAVLTLAAVAASHESAVHVRTRSASSVTR